MLKILSSLYSIFIIKQLTIHTHVCAYIWIFYSISLVHLLSLFQYHTTFMNVVLINLEVTGCYSCNFFFQEFVVLSTLHFHVQFSNTLLTSTQKKISLSFIGFYWVYRNSNLLTNELEFQQHFIGFTRLGIFMLLKDVPLEIYISNCKYIIENLLVLNTFS